MPVADAGNVNTRPVAEAKNYKWGAANVFLYSQIFNMSISFNQKNRSATFTIVISDIAGYINVTSARISSDAQLVYKMYPLIQQKRRFSPPESHVQPKSTRQPSDIRQILTDFTW